ncbi:response regulator [Pseudoteredinibacter isoporae]|uniref:DNA-binding NarL/FixJ family response regulator n=1 Tax=Pseudoteredinibacter isoporae TaxID=570281 RepID=A0A7X0MWX8_9GAMM|nr:response regulator transcription factor [Pseudoteredinibacter isoporae]MBB6521464.1 DNA-binding NarL/FixJ family response regulator [Pseudoteredinibacter isoporae]NHO87018.1 response regulator transcription factor [Pseudoteredinibacter isoporae]NIB24529.1 response regulator transcription factor [Pseudoteredinibacter isoporae]
MKILSLDDHPLFSAGLKESLSKFNPDFDIVTTLTTNDALSYLREHNDIDLLILDLSMPDMNGILFIKTLMARGFQIPIVIMSGSEDLLSLQEAFKLGVLGFLPKAWSVERVAKALMDIKAGDMVIPDDIARRLNRMPKYAMANTQTSLSERQLEVLELVRKGLSNHDIASTLYISEATVKSHLQTIFKILDGKNRMDCVRKAVAAGILPSAL